MVMSTDLQEDLAEAIVKNKSLPRYRRKNKGELIKSVGYGGLTAKKRPTEILEAKGVKEALKNWGLTEGLITKSLVDDIKKKPTKRLGELALGADILGMKETPQANKTLIVVISGESAKRYGGGTTSLTS